MPGAPASTSRRTLLRAAAGAAVAGLGLPLWARPANALSPYRLAAATAGVPVSMAMHLHGSFSEGTGSMHAHLDQASQLGVDVLFWTDHDFRVSAQGYRQQVQFAGWEEYENDVRWTWVRSTIGALRSSSVTFEQWNHGDVAVLDAVADTSNFSALWLTGDAWNTTYRTSLADTTLELDVFPDDLGDDARFILHVDTSHHPVSGGRPAGQYMVSYRVGPYQQVRRYVQGTFLGVVEVPAARWAWTQLALRPVDDIAVLWPDLIPGDNSLYTLRIGVETRNGARSRYAVNRIGFVREQRAGNASVDLLRSVMAGYADRYPGQRQYESLEVSLVRHLNWFGGDVTMPDYGAQAPFKDNSEQAASAMVDFIHSHGGLACYNHPMYDTKEVVAQSLVQTANLGADMIEVGCACPGAPESIGDMLYVFDALARNTVFVTGNGVTDDHDGANWVGRNVNWITGAWSGSVELTDLTGAMSAGRLWFWRPGRWSGELDLRIGDQPAMGGVLVTPDDKVSVRFMATALPSGGSLEIVTGLADRAAAEPAVTSRTVPASDVVGGWYELDVAPEDGVYVRTMVRDSAGAVIGVGNPLWLLRSEPPDGIPAARRLPSA